MESESSLWSRRRRGVAVFTAATVVFLLLLIGLFADRGSAEVTPSSSPEKRSTTGKNRTHRKLLRNENVNEKGVEPNRIWSEKCSKSDIVISQGSTESLPNGIPTYTVEIMNACVSGCDISGIHLTCGWFSSSRLINPHVFKRLGYNDCLVNNGTPLANGRTVSFQYANTFRYPLAVSSVRC